MRYEQMEADAKRAADRAFLNQTIPNETYRQLCWQSFFHFQLFTLINAEKQRMVDEAGGEPRQSPAFALVEEQNDDGTAERQEATEAAPTPSEADTH